MLRPPVSRIPRIVRAPLLPVGSLIPHIKRAPLVAGTGIEPVFSAYETEEISLPPTRNVFLKLKNLQQKKPPKDFHPGGFWPGKSFTQIKTF